MAYALTDLGNAERLRDSIKHDMCYCPDWGQWLVWKGNRWCIDQDGEILIRVKQVIKDMGKKAVEDASEGDVAHVKKSQGLQSIEAMIKLASRDRELVVRSKDFDANGMILNCLNGIIDLTTGELMPHDKSHYCTKLAHALYRTGDMPGIWPKFISDIMHGDKELIEFLQRALGYSITASLKEQCMFILHGSGSNGKSKFIEAVRATLGDYCRATSPSALTTRKYGEAPRNDIARLCGARFVSAVEMNPKYGSNIDGAVVKQMTGDDTIEARFLYKEAFEFVPTWKVWLATNHRPEIPSTDQGMWRRVRLIPFTASFTGVKDDKEILQKLLSNRGEILTWMVQGCLRWQKEGLSQSEAIETAVREYREDQDPINEFLRVKCYTHPEATIGVAELYEHYMEFCKENHEKYLGKHEFGWEMKKNQSIKQGRDNVSRFWLGVALKKPIKLTQLEDDDE